MKVIGFVGSGRIGGNTDTLVQEALAGATENGAITKKFYLHTMNIKGCSGCDYCKKTNDCIINDDMQEIYKDISTANALIIGSPIYMMQVSAQTKLLIDRLYAFRNGDGSFKIEQKKLLLLYVCKYPDPTIYNQYFQLMNTLFSFLGLFKVDSTITAGATIGKDDIKNNLEVLQLAKAAGTKLTVF
jgi:multimeric flavodoxin WrbA